MTNWIIIPALAGIVLAGAVQAQPYQGMQDRTSKFDTVAGAPVVSGPDGQFIKPGEIVPAAPGATYGAPTIQLPSPEQPLAGVTLPNQGRGDGAYNGGGVVLEQDSNGVTRQVR